MRGLNAEKVALKCGLLFILKNLPKVNNRPIWSPCSCPMRSESMTR
jgi:hypothetical protein